MNKSKRIILLMIFILAPYMVKAQESELVYPGQDGKLVYVPHVNTGETDAVNIIPDFSMCGYKGGGVPIPDVPVKITVSPQEGNDRQRIQDAINYVSGLTPDANGFRGAVFLKAGTYEINDGNIPSASNGTGNALLISKSGVVLRGEGQGPDGTILISDAEKQHTLLCIQPLSSPQRTVSNTTRITDPYVGTGAKSFNVQSTSGYSVGNSIFVIFTPNSKWLADINVNSYLNVANGDILWDTVAYRIRYERIITSIDGNTISINSPVVLPMQTKYGGGQISLMTITGGERLYNIGVEDLRIQGAGITATCPENSSKRLQFAIRPRFVENGWIHGVTAVNVSESTVKTWGCSYFTVEECAYIEPLGPKEGGWRYAFCLDAESQHILFQRNYSYDGRHDFVSHARIPGPNVFLDCYSELGTTIGPHERFATGTLFDNLSMKSLMAVSEHRGTSGSGHGWAGVQQIGWNLECESIVCDAPLGYQNYNIGCIGTEVLSSLIDNTSPGVYRGYYESPGAHVDTRSLYLKQLEDRLDSVAVSNVTVPEQRTGTIYKQLANWAGNGPFISTFVHVAEVSITPASATISSKLQLTATVLPLNATDKTVNWTSSNPAVAIVSSSGLVTPIAEGTTTITAVTEDGGKTATSTISVNNITYHIYAASEDAFVRGGTYSDTNYGSSTALEIKQGSVSDFFRKGLIKFDLTTGELSNIGSAKLRLYAKSVSETTVSVYEISDDWTEATLTWNNAPANGNIISSVAVSSANVYYEFDVSAYVSEQLAGDKIVSMGIWDLSKANVNIVFNSREAAMNFPELIVQTSATHINEPESGEFQNEFDLFRTYPNPFNTATHINYVLTSPSAVSLVVFNLLGQEVARLVDGVFQPAGTYSVRWDAGKEGPGLYVCFLQTDNYLKSKSILCIKK
jgi:hypothetical protein